MGQALGHSDLVGSAQQGAEGRLSGQHHGEHEAAVHVEVGEQPQHGQRFGPQVMALIHYEDGTQAIGVGVLREGLLEATHQSWIDAGGR